MNKLQKTLGLGALVMGLIGCNDNKSQVEYQTIVGKPLSAKIVIPGGSCGGVLSILLDVEGKATLAITRNAHIFYCTSSSSLAQGAMLVENEIMDGDNDNIQLLGKYRGNKFEIKSLQVDNYIVDYLW